MKKYSKVGKRPGRPAFRMPSAIRNKLLASLEKSKHEKQAVLLALKNK